MKKTKEECLLMNGIMSFDLGKNESKFFKAMDDYATSEMIEENKSMLEMAKKHSDYRAVLVLNDRISSLEKTNTK
jgi:hypothetical protein